MAENNNKVMKNVLCKNSFYKNKGVMIYEMSLGVSYNTVTPFLFLKFANRDNNKSAGKWNDDNCYWVPGLDGMVDFEGRLNTLLRHENSTGKKLELKNPSKKTYLGILTSFDDKSGTQYYVITYSRDKDAKVTLSLTREELVGFYKILKGFIDNYFVAAQMVLNRMDNWFNLYGKNNKSYKDNNNSYKNNNSKSGGSGKQYSKREEPPPSHDNFMDSIENNMPSMGDDVPF